MDFSATVPSQLKWKQKDSGHMEWQAIERDFMCRTLEIIDQYDTKVMPNVGANKRFEVTLLINCLLGLLVVPFELRKRDQKNTRYPQICTGDDEVISKLDANWGLENIDVISFNVDGQDLGVDQRTLRCFAAMLRHSCAHSRFEDDKSQHKSDTGVAVDYTDSQIPGLISQITRVRFRNHYRDTAFEVVIPVEDLKKFSKKLASVIRDELDQITFTNSGSQAV